MATAAEIAALRRLIAEPDATTYDDAALTLVIDTADSLDAAALLVWEEKAASYVGLVDISEGGSQRKNGDLIKQASAMIEVFQGRIDLAAAGAPTRIRKLTRT